MRIITGLILIALLAFVSSAWLTRPVVEGTLDPTVFDTLALAPVDEAITLAMSRTGEVLLVNSVNAEGLTAINLSSATGQAFADSLEAHARLGAEGLRDLLNENSVTGEFSWDSLGLPIRPLPVQIAAGTNYRAHAREVGLDEEPFLFPKLSAPTSWNESVLPGSRLDYEVELCAVLLSQHSSTQAAGLGYTLCGDYTDRWILVRDIKLDGPMGRTGFPLAKGGVSRLPVGPLLVIPAAETFYEKIQLSLYLNNTLRQQDVAGSMIWSPREILDKALADCAPDYVAGEEKISLTDCESIPAGTLLLTGTSAGVMFRLATLWNPWAYLKAGDVVTSFGTFLGMTRDEIHQD